MACGAGARRVTRVARTSAGPRPLSPRAFRALRHLLSGSFRPRHSWRISRRIGACRCPRGTSLSRCRPFVLGLSRTGRFTRTLRITTRGGAASGTGGSRATTRTTWRPRARRARRSRARCDAITRFESPRSTSRTPVRVHRAPACRLLVRWPRRVRVHPRGRLRETARPRRVARGVRVVRVAGRWAHGRIDPRCRGRWSAFVTRSSLRARRCAWSGRFRWCGHTWHRFRRLMTSSRRPGPRRWPRVEIRGFSTASCGARSRTCRGSFAVGRRCRCSRPRPHRGMRVVGPTSSRSP